MKDVIRICALGIAIAGLMSAACLWTGNNNKEVPAPLTSEEISWNEFCKARGYDCNTNDDEIINEFLDTWVGSAEEKRVFNNLPALEV